jgi:hypothetical protein
MCESPMTSYEHAPPQCIFPKSGNIKSNKNLKKIKVPSCNLHNSAKSQDDEYLLYVLTTTITSNNIGLNHFYDKTIRAAKRKPKLSFELLKNSIPVRINDFEKNREVNSHTLNADKNRIDSVLEKCARALYFHHTKNKITGKANVICSFILNANNIPFNQQITKALLISEKIFNPISSFGDYPVVFNYKITEDQQSVLIRLAFYETTKAIVEFRKPANSTN